MKGEIDLNKSICLFVCLFVCLGQIHSVVFFWESLRKILHIIKCHRSRFIVHLAVSTEQVLLQTNNGCSLALYGSLYD